MLICSHTNMSENAHGPEPAKATWMINDVQDQVHCQSIPHLKAFVVMEYFSCIFVLTCMPWLQS